MVAAGITVLGVLAATAVTAWAGYSLLVLMFQIMGGGA
jgi:hypothetical protein